MLWPRENNDRRLAGTSCVPQLVQVSSAQTLVRAVARPACAQHQAHNIRNALAIQYWSAIDDCGGGGIFSKYHTSQGGTPKRRRGTVQLISYRR